MPDSFLTVDEIAELLKVNPQTVRNWIDRGELPAVRIGSRRVRVRQSDLDRFIEAGATSAPDGSQAPCGVEDAPSAAALRERLGVALDQTSHQASSIDPHLCSAMPGSGGSGVLASPLLIPALLPLPSPPQRVLGHEVDEDRDQGHDEILGGLRAACPVSTSRRECPTSCPSERAALARASRPERARASTTPAALASRLRLCSSVSARRRGWPHTSRRRRIGHAVRNASPTVVGTVPACTAAARAAAVQAHALSTMKKA